MSVAPRYWGTWKGFVLKAIAFEGKLSWKEIQQSSGLDSYDLNQALSELFALDIISKTNDTYWIEDYELYKEYKNYCEKTGQKIPKKTGNIYRVIFESLAFRYRQVLDQLQNITNKKIEKIYVVGGGSRNGLLCQFTANVTNLPVDSGPAEASSIGNILMQAKAKKEIGSPQELRKIVRNSFEIRSFKPRAVPEWSNAYKTYLKYYEMQKNVVF